MSGWYALRHLSCQLAAEVARSEAIQGISPEHNPMTSEVDITLDVMFRMT